MRDIAVTSLLRRGASVAAIALLVAAFVGPLEERAHDSFAAHMVQHVLIFYGVAFLLALSGLPNRLPELFRNPFLCGPAAVAAMSLWHLPALYRAAIDSQLLHGAQHLSFLVTGLTLWAMAIGPRRAPEPIALLVVFVTGFVGAAVGALITFAGTVVYPAESLADQQLAGVIMWIPPGIFHLAVMVVLAARLLATPAHASASR